MPVAQFPGTRNWGYDGVHPYAAQNSYGGPDGLQRLVDACHAAGLAVFLDVVYNHLGPEGNYLHEFGPYFNDHYRTPWGSAVNFDGRGCDAVRDYVVDNARMWLEEFHFDGLRLDAVHAIYDLGARHILRSIEEAAEGIAARRGWPATIVAESDLNDPRLLEPRERGGYGLAAQWADDFHHAAHALFTGEVEGYYADFGGPAPLARALECPFVYAWNYSPYRGRYHGAPPVGLSGSRFVVCLQNHDQVGNRARGDRLIGLIEPASKRRLAAGVLLLSPYLPLLFMGEEYGEEAPFPFFCSFGDPALVEAVRAGRKREFEAFSWQGEVPDPQAEETFDSAKLSWSWPEGTLRAGLRRLHRDLLSARREWPALRDFDRRSVRLLGEEDRPILELVRGGDATGGSIRALFNLGDQPARLRGASTSGRRSCSTPRPRPMAATAPRMGRPMSWPRSSSSSWAPLPGGPSPPDNERGQPPGRSRGTCRGRSASDWSRCSRMLPTRRIAMRVWPGNPYPLGATWDGAGVNFALFAEHATKVELCLFDGPDATKEAHRIPFKEYTDKVWHAYLPDVLPGQLYGYRVHGPYEPPNGHRFNPNKLVLDPYAKLIGRDLKWDDSLFGYKLGDPEADLSFDDRDSAPYAPLAVGDRPGVHLGGRPAAAHPLAQDGHLRAARQGLHPAQPERPRAPARHLRRAGLRVGHQAPDRPGRHGRRAAAGPPPPRRPPPRREGAGQLLGIQHPGLLRPERRTTRTTGSSRTPCSSSR